jgi:hypothetical protein
MLDDMSKIDPKDAPEPLSNTPSDGAAKELQPSVDAPKPKPKGDWRAVRDPNSGLIYYYHVITKEVSYVSPFGFFVFLFRPLTSHVFIFCFRQHGKNHQALYQGKPQLNGNPLKLPREKSQKVEKG